MGEVTQIQFTAKGLRDFARLFAAELVTALDRPSQQGGAATSERPSGGQQSSQVVELDPWIIFDPKRQTKVAAYLDDRNQQRWVPCEDEHGVPKAWRKIYVTRVIP